MTASTASDVTFGGLDAPSGSNPLVWAPLRASFRPASRVVSRPPQPPQPPQPPTPPQPPLEPVPPIALARVATTPGGAGDFDNSFSSSSSSSSSSSVTPSVPRSIRLSASSFQPTLSASTPRSSFATNSPPTLFARGDPSPTSGDGGVSGIISSTGLDDDDDDDQPTRAPMIRFRPTPAPSTGQPSSPAPTTTTITSTPNLIASAGISSQTITINNNTSNPYRLSKECFECICEASTSCNEQSRCQTSDVRHTRCGLFLISYDQWLTSGLSEKLVTPEALARDVAADERAFYHCVTDRLCAERVLRAYMQKTGAKDCDKDGRLDCYDAAAIHHSGTEECAGETLLNSQYWNDFSACYGFGR